MSSNQLIKPEPPPLPTTSSDWQRFLKTQRTINDEVESVHIELLNSKNERDRYQSLLWAVYDEQAVEGSLSCDNCLAASMIRNHAESKDSRNPLVKEKLATISKSLGVVLRRYHQSRQERRDMIDGKPVTPDPRHSNPE